MRKILLFLLFLYGGMTAQNLDHSITEMNTFHDYVDSLKSGLLLNIQSEEFETVTTYKVYTAGSSDVTIGGVAFSPHDSLVEASFVVGYESFGMTYTGTINQLGTGNIYSHMLSATSNGSKMYIRSVNDLQSGSAYFFSYRFYPTINIFMPAGSNNYTRIFNSTEIGGLFSVIVTGASVADTNTTGYDVEFIGEDPVGETPVSSFSNGYIAGQIMALSDSLDVSIWTIRYLAREHGLTWTQQDGYGEIVPDSIFNNYDFTIDYDTLDTYDYNLTGNPTVSIDFSDQFGTKSGQVYRNDIGIEIDSLFISSTKLDLYFDDSINEHLSKWLIRIPTFYCQVYIGSAWVSVVSTPMSPIHNTWNNKTVLTANISFTKLSDGTTATGMTGIKNVHFDVLFYNITIDGYQTWYYE